MFCGLHKETGTHINTAVLNYFITMNNIIGSRPDKVQRLHAYCKQTLDQGHGFNTQHTI